jgi:hypothetical protein
MSSRPKVTRKIAPSATRRNSPPEEKQNSLDVDLVTRHLAFMARGLRGVKLASDRLKKQLMSRIDRGDLTYGSIDPSVIVPYLEIDKEIMEYFTLDQDPLVELGSRKSAGCRNALSVFDKYDKAYLQDVGFKQVLDSHVATFLDKSRDLIEIADTRSFRITVDDVDDFPYIQLDVMNGVTGDSVIKINTVPFGLQNSSPLYQIVSIYGCTLTEYVKFYEGWNYPRARTFLKYLVETELYSLSIYNRTADSVFGIERIVNIPNLAGGGFTVASDFFEWLDERIAVDISNKQALVDAPVPIEDGFAAQYKLLKYWQKRLNAEPASPEQKQRLKFLKFAEYTGVDIHYQPAPGGRVYDYFAGLSPDDAHLIPRNFRRDRRQRSPLTNETLLEQVSADSIRVLYQLYDPRNGPAGMNQRQQLEYALVQTMNNEYHEGEEEIIRDCLTYIHIDPEYFYWSEEMPRFDDHLYNIALLEVYASSLGFSLPRLSLDNYEQMHLYCYIKGTMAKYEFPEKCPELLIPRINNALSDSDILKGSSITPVLLALCDDLLIPQIIDAKILFTILRQGSTDDLPISSRNRERHKQFVEFTDKQQTMLGVLYGTKDLDANVFCFIPRKDVMANCEDLIRDYNGKNIVELAESVGMKIPPGSDSMEYFMQSLPYCEAILSRGDFNPKAKNLAVEDLKLLTDHELIRYVLRGYPGYASREDLLKLATEALTTQSRMTLFVKDPPEIRNTFFDESFAFGLSKNKYAVCFVTSQRGQNYNISLDELDLLNHRDKVGGKVEAGDQILKFKLYVGQSDKSGYPTGVEINLAELDNIELLLSQTRDYWQKLIQRNIKKGRLKSPHFSPSGRLLPSITEEKGFDEDDQTDDLAQIYRNQNAFDSLAETIIICRGITAAANEDDAAVRKAYYALAPADRKILIKMLIILFDCGMHQRQWNGVRGRYPMLKSETGDENSLSKNKEALIELKLIALKDIKEELIESGKLNIVLLFNNLRMQVLTRADRVESSSFFTSNNSYTVVQAQDYLNNPQVCDPNGRDRDRVRQLREFVAEAERRQDQYLDNSNFRITVIYIIYDVLHVISQGAYGAHDAACLRMGSSKMINTAFYYLQLFGEADQLGFYEYWKLVNIV